MQIVFQKPVLATNQLLIHIDEVKYEIHAESFHLVCPLRQALGWLLFIFYF